MAELVLPSQVERMMHPQHVSQPLSSVTLVQMQRTMVAGMGAMRGPQHGLPLTKANLAAAKAGCANRQQQRLTLSP